MVSQLLRYQNHSIETAQVMEEPVEMAKKFREAARRGEALALGDETLKKIAHGLTENLRANINAYEPIAGKCPAIH